MWWVRGLACEMKSVRQIEGDTAWINGWGFAQNQPGKQIPTIPWEEGLKVYDKNKDGKIAADEVDRRAGAALDRMLQPERAASRRSTPTATDFSTPATGTSCARCSRPRTACSRSSSAARGT